VAKPTAENASNKGESGFSVLRKGIMKPIYPLLVSGLGIKTKLATKQRVACSSIGVDKCGEIELCPRLEGGEFHLSTSPCNNLSKLEKLL
jgi:hypothetical protein